MNLNESVLLQALRDADWESLLPHLIAYAARRLRRAGWAQGRDVEPSKMSAEQLVNTAIEHCLDGSRAWDPDNVDFPGFLRGIIRSLTSSERKGYVRAKTLTSSEVVGRKEETTTSAEDDAIAEEGRVELLAVFEDCVRDDDDLHTLYTCILEGYTKREDIAEALGWTGDRVTAARIKLQRRLVRRAPEKFAATRDRQKRVLQ